MSDAGEFAAAQRDIVALLTAGAGLSRVAMLPDVEIPDEFPPAGIDLVYHVLRVRFDVGETGVGDEILTLFGQMLVEREEHYTNDDGLRAVDFHVRSWMATGWSWSLRQSVAYVLSEGVEQPVSAIVSEQREADFPATFSFNVIFDVRADNQLVFPQQHGKPEGRGFRVVPPNGNRRLSPRIRTFEDTRVSVDHPSLGRVVAIPIDCNDQGSITLASF